MKILLMVLTSIVLITTLAPLIRTGIWWIRSMDFLRLQTACIALIATVLIALFFRDEREMLWLLAPLGLCLAYQGRRLYPYTLVSPRQVLPALSKEPNRRFRLLVANIQMDNRRADRFLNLIWSVSPDIICLLEPDGWWAEQLQVLRQRYPHAVQHPQDNFYGMVLYSRVPIVQASVNFLVEDEIPSIRATMELRSGVRFDLYCLHPRPPLPADNTEERDAELLIVAKQVRQLGRPSVVCGDLNDVAGSHVNNLFQNISGLLDPRIGRGFYNTHPTYLPFMRAPVDHVFHSNEFRLVTLERLPDTGSDHFPILIELSYEPAHQAEQVEPAPTKEEKETAEAMIAEAQ
jgi:endonuclease/exonuclease/phosphatase (EEP) superfamily protein YafD